MLNLFKRRTKKKFQELTSDYQKSNIITKLAVGKYKIKRKVVEIPLNQNTIIILNNSDFLSVYSFFKERFEHNGEHTYKTLYKKLQSEQIIRLNIQKQPELEGKSTDLIKILKNYKKSETFLGLDNNFYFKLYKQKEPSELERELEGRSWINFEQQINKYHYIFDDKKENGIWAGKKEKFLESVLFDKEQIELYGYNLLILKTFLTHRYIKNEMEIIGNCFKVIYNGYILDIKFWNSLLEKNILNQEELLKIKSNSKEKFPELYEVIKEINK